MRVKRMPRSGAVRLWRSVATHWGHFDTCGSSLKKSNCIYEGPSEAAIREAAKLNKLPVDSVTEVPVPLTPK